MTTDADNKKEEHNDYEDIELTIEELEEYFIKTVEDSEIHDDIDKTLFDEDARWLTYYINPPCGLSVKINNTLFSYEGQRIDKLVIYESGNSKRIYCYDRNDHWVEDVDILTQEPYENIRFIFEYGDLKTCSTTDKEQQSYVQLYEQLSPYMPVEENRRVVQKWFEEHPKFELPPFELPPFELPPFEPKHTVTLPTLPKEETEALLKRLSMNPDNYKPINMDKPEHSYEPHYISSEDIEKMMTNKKGHINCEDSKSK